jgi:hypothetical protein
MGIRFQFSLPLDHAQKAANLALGIDVILPGCITLCAKMQLGWEQLIVLPLNLHGLLITSTQSYELLLGLLRSLMSLHLPRPKTGYLCDEVILGRLLLMEELRLPLAMRHQ